MIREEVLKKYNPVIKTYNKEEIIFYAGQKPEYYYQILKGQVKMSYYNEKGHEFTLGLFSDNESFGEPPLLGNFDYPANAEAVFDSTVYLLDFQSLKLLLKENFDIHLLLTSNLSKRIGYKSFMMKEIAVYDPEHRIISLIDYFKKNIGKDNQEFKLPFTRQQIANMTGLSVETVIRTIKKLESKNILKIINGKIYK